MAARRPKKKKSIPVHKSTTEKKLPVVKRPIVTSEEAAQIEAALASDEMKGSVGRWAKIFGLWGTHLLLALALAMPAPGQAPAPEPTVTCRDHALINGEQIVLADLAEIVAPNLAMERALGEVTLGPAPQLGQERPVSRALIASRLAQSGFDARSIRFAGPATVTVERDAHVVSRAELEAKARELLPPALGQTTDSLVVESLRFPNQVVLPPGDVTWDLRLNGSRRPTGPISFELIACGDSGEVARVQGMAQVDVAVRLVTLVTDAPRGTTITPDMVQTVDGTLRGAPPSALTDAQSAIGMMTTQSVRAGSVLTDRAVAPPQLVRRGEVVTVIFESGALRITNRAESLQNGAAGDEVTVRNLQSQRTIQALVTGPRTVRVIN
jgi:flagella basal body P-ring formation protein FlgA